MDLLIRMVKGILGSSYACSILAIVSFMIFSLTIKQQNASEASFFLILCIFKNFFSHNNLID